MLEIIVPEQFVGFLPGGSTDGSFCRAHFPHDGTEFAMQVERILRTTPVQRLKLALIPLGIVDLILVPISLLGGSPSLAGVVLVNILAVAILVLRFAVLYFWRLRCRACGRGPAADTGTDDGRGYPVVRCPSCGREWIL